MRSRTTSLVLANPPAWRRELSQLFCSSDNEMFSVFVMEHRMAACLILSRFANAPKILAQEFFNRAVRSDIFRVPEPKPFKTSLKFLMLHNSGLNHGFHGFHGQGIDPGSKGCLRVIREIRGNIFTKMSDSGRIAARKVIRAGVPTPARSSARISPRPAWNSIIRWREWLRSTAAIGTSHSSRPGLPPWPKVPRPSSLPSF